MARNPRGGDILLAAHTGLYRLRGGNVTRVSPVMDLMGFTVMGPDHFYASGHPSAEVNLPQPMGLVESTDGGRTWRAVSRGGQSDFHLLARAGSGVLGYDGELLHSVDGLDWLSVPSPGEMLSLAVAPDGKHLVAATPSGVMRSQDGAGSWAPVPDAPALRLVAWGGPGTVAGVTEGGSVAISRDAGASWKVGSAELPTEPHALSASGTSRGGLEILVATDEQVLRTTDDGGTFERLTD